MPDPGPAPPPLAATADDLDAQCRGIGTSAARCAARAAAPSAGAAHRTAPPARAGLFDEVPVARATLRDGDGATVRQAPRAP